MIADIESRQVEAEDLGGPDGIVQIATDYLASRLVDRIGFRVPVVLAHVVAVLGLVLLAVLPGPVAPYPALLIATLFLGAALIGWRVLARLSSGGWSPDQRAEGVG